jgi:TolA-binding protein
MKSYGKHRVSKQDLKEDRFQVFTEKAVAAYYKDPKRFWIIGGVAIAAIIAIILLAQGQKKGVNSEAELRFTEAVGIYSTGNMQQAEQALSDVAARFGNDYVGLKAHYYLGNVYYNTQRFEEAKREFSRYLGKVKNEPLLSPAAQMGIADCEVQLGNAAVAAEAYRAVKRRWPKSPLVFEAEMAAARAYRAAGSVDKAEAVYKELLEGKPTGENAEQVKTELASIEAQKKKF